MDEGINVVSDGGIKLGKELREGWRDKLREVWRDKPREEWRDKRRDGRREEREGQTYIRRSNTL